MQETLKEQHLQGSPVSDGIAIGEIFFLEELATEAIPTVCITAAEIDQEIRRYRNALDLSRKRLESIQYSLAKEGAKEALAIMRAQRAMLDDPVLTEEVEEGIKRMQHNTAAVFRMVISRYEAQFPKDDPFFSQRLIDVKDLSARILEHLHPSKKSDPLDSSNRILFAEDIIPSFTAEVSTTDVLGFVTKRLEGGTSHAAIVARSKGLPYVSGIDIEYLRQWAGSLVIVDGHTGKLILFPTSETLQTYRDRLHKAQQEFMHFASAHPTHVTTQDGVAIDVWANIGTLEDLTHLEWYNIAGIGLIRSEFLHHKKDILAITEDEQTLTYREMVAKTEDRPVYFRVFDIGGDKNFSHEVAQEINPAFGCRSIRFLLRHPLVLHQQLRALFKVLGGRGNVHVILPFITDVTELREVKERMEEIKTTLVAEGYDIPEKIHVGCMIEMPAAVVLSDQIAAESDSLCIGTNDLEQYVLADDRRSTAMYDMYKSAHPSILRMIHTVIENGRQHKVPVSICGEVASNPLFTALLIGLGIRRFSCPPRCVPLIKETVMQIPLFRAEKLAKEALLCTSTTAVTALLTEHYCQQTHGQC